MKILVVAAHPDDEALGCGGTIARHAKADDEISLLFLADGVSARGHNPDAREARQKAALMATGLLGVRHVGFEPLSMQVRDNRLDMFALHDLVMEVEAKLQKWRPRIIYTHHGGDLNIDHRITHQAVMTACRPMPGSSVKAIYAFEVPSSTEWASESEQAFRPNHFVDISSTLDKKLEALKAYEEEMRPFPHARSIEAVRALAVWRGASVGLRAAEAFMTIRRIEA